MVSGVFGLGTKRENPGFISKLQPALGCHMPFSHFMDLVDSVDSGNSAVWGGSVGSVVAWWIRSVAWYSWWRMAISREMENYNGAC